MVRIIAKYTSSALRKAGPTRSITISLQSEKTLERPQISATFAREENIRNVQQLTGVTTLETAEFRALGTPQTVLSINSPASVALYIRRGLLLSIYGISSDSDRSTISSIRSTLEVIKPFSRWVYGRYASGYQKVISTAPFSVLVSANSRKLFLGSGNKSFVNLVLDGSNDWAILNKDALQVYTGNSLIVSVYSLPRFISRQLVKRLGLKGGSQKTGLFRWYRSGYTLLSGRGQVGLVGNGSVYNINLGPEEELLVNEKNLLGITVNGPFDLSNCTHKYSFPITVEEPVKETVLGLGQVHQQPISLISKAKEYGKIAAFYWRKLASYIAGGKAASYNFLVGNQEFIKVIGPRSLLLQSGHLSRVPSPSRAIVRDGKRNVLHNSTLVSHNDPTWRERTPADYLNYVTIENGKGVFTSTSDFKETVREIEKTK